MITTWAGWLVPVGAVAAWAARAIDYGTDIDVPHDSTELVSVDGAARARLLEVLPEIDPLGMYREIAARGVPVSDVPVTLAAPGSDGVGAAAERRGGYVYLAAWITAAGVGREGWAAP